MLEETTTTDSPKPWSHRRQEFGVIVWASFLAACFATLMFFAFFDPVQLASDDDPPAWLANRMTGYAVGFFFFWLVTAVASLLTAYLIDTLPPDKEKTTELKR